MSELLHDLLRVVIPLFAISSMSAVGLGYDFLHVTRPLLRPAMVLTALLANFVVVPLLALLLLRTFDLGPMQAVGLLLISSAAGAPFLLKLVSAAGGDLALAGGLLLLLLPASIVSMPIVIPLVLPRAQLDLRAITTLLVLTMLLPLAAGFAVRWRWGTWAKRLLPILGKLSTFLLVLLVGATFLENLGGIASLLGTAAIPAAALLTMGAVVAGYTLGVPTTDSRVVLALGTGQRNVAAATIAASAFRSDEPLEMVVVSSLVAFAVLFPAARLLRRWLGGRSGAGSLRSGAPDGAARRATCGKRRPARSPPEKALPSAGPSRPDSR
jgi:BASS family bile acid:Na+ symporter